MLILEGLPTVLKVEEEGVILEAVTLVDPDAPVESLEAVPPEPEVVEILGPEDVAMVGLDVDTTLSWEVLFWIVLDADVVVMVNGFLSELELPILTAFRPCAEEVGVDVFMLIPGALSSI